MRPPLNLDFQWLSVPLLVAHMISIAAGHGGTDGASAPGVYAGHNIRSV